MDQPPKRAIDRVVKSKGTAKKEGRPKEAMEERRGGPESEDVDWEGNPYERKGHFSWGGFMKKVEKAGMVEPASKQSTGFIM